LQFAAINVLFISSAHIIVNNLKGYL